MSYVNQYETCCTVCTTLGCNCHTAVNTTQKYRSHPEHRPLIYCTVKNATLYHSFFSAASSSRCFSIFCPFPVISSGRGCHAGHGTWPANSQTQCRLYSGPKLAGLRSSIDSLRASLFNFALHDNPTSTSSSLKFVRSVSVAGSRSPGSPADSYKWFNGT